MTAMVKACLGLMSVVGGSCAIGIPLSSKSSSTALTSESKRKGGVIELEEKEKWDTQDLDNLAKFSVKVLKGNFDNSSISEIVLTKTGEGSYGEPIWRWSNFADLRDKIDLLANEEGEETMKIRRFFEYIVEEWKKTSWDSSWAGEHWGTLWSSQSENVMMTGSSVENGKKVLLKIKLKQDIDSYVIGQYRKQMSGDNQKLTGELSLGLIQCSSKSGPQCQIDKGQSIFPKLKLTISSN